MSMKPLGILLLLLTGIIPARASEELPWAVTVQGTDRIVRAGERFEVRFRIDLLPGYHIYPEGTTVGTPFRVSADPKARFQPEGPLSGPPPSKHRDGEEAYDIHQGSLVLTQGFRVPRDLAPGAYVLRGTYQGQVCDDSMCLSIDETPWEVRVNVEAGPAREAVVAEGSQTAPASPDALPRDLLPFLATAVGAALLTLLTPCVFPMIPVTISFFTKQVSTTRSGALKAAAAYGLGIMASYTGLGLGLSLILKSAGAANTLGAHWAVNAFIAAVFVIFSLSLFGAFELTLPEGLMSRLGGARSTQLPGILFLGLTFSLTSFTCSVQFVGLLLALAANGEWFWPLLGFLAFSGTLAAPFFLLALFPQALQSLPKRGGWLNSVKVLMGFIELAAAFKFLSNVDLYFHQDAPWLTRPAVLLAWTAISVAAALYLLGKIRLPHDDASGNGSIGAGRLLLAILFLSFAGYFFSGVDGSPLESADAWLPPRQSGGRQISWKDVPKVETWEGALAQAKSSGRPLFIDFTGITCTNCRKMEASILLDPAVREELSRMVVVELYVDGQGEDKRFNKQLQIDRFKQSSQPHYVVLSPDGKTETGQFPGFTRDRDKYLAWLKSASEKARAGR